MGMQKALGMHPWRCGAGRKGGEEEGATKPAAIARGLWTALQASVRRILYLGNACTWASRLHGLGEPGQGHQVVSCWTMKDTLKDIVLTFGYAKDLGNAPVEVWGWQGRRRGGRIQGLQSRLSLRMDCGMNYKH